MGYTRDAQGNVVKKSWFGKPKTQNYDVVPIPPAAHDGGLSEPILTAKDLLLTIKELQFAHREDLGAVLQNQARLHELLVGVNEKLGLLLEEKPKVKK